MGKKMDFAAKPARLFLPSSTSWYHVTGKAGSIFYIQLVPIMHLVSKSAIKDSSLHLCAHVPYQHSSRNPLCLHHVLFKQVPLMQIPGPPNGVPVQVASYTLSTVQ